MTPMACHFQRHVFDVILSHVGKDTKKNIEMQKEKHVFSNNALFFTLFFILLQKTKKQNG
jgi:hypothetical protein